MTAHIVLQRQASLTSFALLVAAFFLSLSWHDSVGWAAVPSPRQQMALGSNDAAESLPTGLASNRDEGSNKNSGGSSLPTLDALLEAIDVMQTEYFSIDTGIWPTSIDWTAAVLGTHISATLSTFISSIESSPISISCTDTLAWSNLINRYFAHTSAFYFGENALSLRQQAYDDMLWVVLGWLENVKLMDLYTSVRSKAQTDKYHETGRILADGPWHGTQFKPAAAHRARVFYDLASRGWDTSLCNGGMVWNPHLHPYKNSITNELFISASISMYLYFPGDDNDSPFLSSASSLLVSDNGTAYPHSRHHLHNAIKAYDWLKSSNMTNPSLPGLYADGFHISGWHRDPDGQIDPGTGKCDALNTMVYTYNQGVVLTGLRGLWLATRESGYLADGHALVEAVRRATGWLEDNREPDRTVDRTWAGLGRGGVLEEYCDSRGDCSQNGHTFKGIFFHHLAEFCRPLWSMEKEFLSAHAETEGRGDDAAWDHHLDRCERYRGWVQRNAKAGLVTRDERGRFGMWWGRVFPSLPEGEEVRQLRAPPLPANAVDHQNHGSGSDVGAQDETGTQVADHNNEEDGRAGEDVNSRGRGRTVESQSGGVAVLRALWQWEAILPSLAQRGLTSHHGL